MAPFRGVPYEAPSDDAIVSEDDFAARWAALQKKTGGHALGQVVGFLKDRGLLPLRYSSPALSYLCKILGFVFGDGSIHFNGGDGKGVVQFSGQAADLEAIRALTWTRRHHPFARLPRDAITRSRPSTAAMNSIAPRSGSRSSARGSPSCSPAWGLRSEKSRTRTTAPGVAGPRPLWQKRLFLAALFVEPHHPRDDHGARHRLRRADVRHEQAPGFRR